MKIAKPSIQIEKQPVIVINSGGSALAVKGQDFRVFATTDPKSQGNNFVALNGKDANTNEPYDVIVHKDGLSFSRSGVDFEVTKQRVADIMAKASLASDVKWVDAPALTQRQLQSLSPAEKAAYEWVSQTPSKVPVPAKEVIEID